MVTSILKPLYSIKSCPIFGKAANLCKVFEAGALLASGQGGQLPTQFLVENKASPGSGSAASLLLAHPAFGSQLRPCEVASNWGGLLILKDLLNKWIAKGLASNPHDFMCR